MNFIQAELFFSLMGRFPQSSKFRVLGTLQREL